MPEQRIVIYGDRGFGREVHQLITDLARLGAPVACVGFLVDAGYREFDTVHGLPVFGDASWLASAPDVQVMIAIGATAPRYRIARLIESTYRTPFAILQHSHAWVGNHVSVGEGSVICAGAMVPTDISLGRHVQLHVGCTVGHRSMIGDFATIAPGANVSGRVDVGDGVFIGAGAVVVPDVKIGHWAIVGAGAVVTKDVPANSTVVGSPARIIRNRAPGWQLDPAFARQRL
jgi:sugar O-acyltransferase (sialic acid O-acetyltransferase NeuD family)